MKFDRSPNVGRLHKLKTFKTAERKDNEALFSGACGLSAFPSSRLIFTFQSELFFIILIIIYCALVGKRKRACCKKNSELPTKAVQNIGCDEVAEANDRAYEISISNAIASHTRSDFNQIRPSGIFFQCLISLSEG